MNTPEFSRPVDRRRIDSRTQQLSASESERAALARRFGLVAIHRLEARLDLEARGEIVRARGKLEAEIVQSCAVSGEDLPVTLSEVLDFRFVPPVQAAPDEEIELHADDCDEVEYAGDTLDLGEAVAQSLGLAIDPFATGPTAEAARRAAGLLDETAAGPFAALARLKDPKG